MKRQRLELLQEPATFQLIVERAGIIGTVSDGSSSYQPLDTLQVEDPRQAKRQIAADLSTTAARETFASSLADALADEDLLRTCLLPITVTVQASFATGDSLMRMLLNMMPLQQQVATLLLHKLPEFSQLECTDNSNGKISRNSTVPGLILGQLRWLEQVADEAALTATVLEVLPVCSVTIQQQLVGLLPEVVLPQDHEVVVETLQALLDQDLSFMAPVLDCYSNMQLKPHLQDCVVKSLLGQLPAVEVEDLPGLVKYLISSADQTNAEQILSAVRSYLYFVSPVDPRSAVPDRKQKNAMLSKSKTPESLLVKDLISTLQGNEDVIAACLKLEAAITETSDHRCFDLLVLLALLAKPGASRRSAEVCLRRKLVAGHVTHAWLSRSLQGRQSTLHDLWPSLMFLAESWSRAREAPLTAAAVQLWVDLFVGGLERQHVLQALHGHLGSGVAREQDVAIQALRVLADCHWSELSQYSSYLANVLDHLDGFSDSQLQQVFSMLAALTAVQPVAAEASSSAAGGSSVGGTRLQDELIITLNKALAQNTAQYKRIGVVGNLALLQQSASDYAILLSADEDAAGRLQESWSHRADSVFAQCLGHPGVMAFMMDQWAEMLEQSAEHAATDGANNRGRMPLPMLEWLNEKANEMMNHAFLVDLVRPTGVSQASEDEAAQTGPQPLIKHDDSNLQARLWFNLDGSYSPVYVGILTLAVSKDPFKRAQLVWLPACLRLMAACLHCSAKGLHTIDALLGCPLALPDASLFVSGSWDGLPLPSKVGVLLSLMHSICWLREVVAVFAPALDSELHRAAGGVNTPATMDNVSDTQSKLLVRAAQLRLLEALFKYLAGTCPSAALQLPDLSVPLLMGPLGATAAATAAAVSKQEQQGQIECDIMCKLRCLRATAALALNVFPDTRMLLTTLLPAAHLVTDLHAKLQVLVNRARRPAGFAAAAAPALPRGLAGLVTPAAGNPFVTAPGPPCLCSVDLQQLAQRIVLQLPALQRHLATALTVIRQPPADEREELFKGLPGWGCQAAEAALYGLSSTAQALEAVPAAHQLALACLQCITLLVKCTKDWSAAQTQVVLAALASQPAAAAYDTTQLLRAAFKSSRKLTIKSSGHSSLQLEMAVLSLLRAITSVAAAHKAPADTQDVMSKRLSLIADELLKCTWQQEDEAEEETVGGFTWKKHTAAITQLLTVLISHAPDPSQQLLLLADDMLKEVPGKVPAKEALTSYGGYAALCSATFVTWYRVVSEQLMAFWERVLAQGQHLMIPATSMRKDASNLQQPQLNSQGMPDWDDEKVQHLLAQAQRCCQAFTTLVQLTKAHQSRKPLLAAAVNLGGKYIEGMLRAMPLWRVLYSSGYDAQFAALVQILQKGTKVLQAVCNEGKAQRAGPLVSKAPAAKKALERFVFEMKAFFHEVGQPDTFWMGNLKHRDLAGNTVGSQLSPPEEDGDDDGDDDDDAEDEEQADEDQEGSAAT